MAENPENNAPEQAPGGDIPGGTRQRRRRDLDSAEGTGPEAGGARQADAAPGPDSGAAPVRRRASLDAQAPGEAVATNRRRLDDSAVLPGSPAPAAAVDELDAEAAKKLAKAAPKAAGDGISGGRRVLRIILLLLLIAGAGFMTLIILEETAPGNRYASGVVTPTFNPLPENPEGERLAETLAAQLSAGQYGMVLAKREEYLRHTPRYYGVLQAVYLADAVGAVKEAHERLASMPTTEADSGSFLAIEERLERLVPRMAILTRMEGFRVDWDGKLLDLPGIREIYDSTAEETYLANRRVAEWRRYLGVFEEVYNDLNANVPAYDFIISRLLPLNEVLPANGVKRLCDNIAALRDARGNVAANDMRAANEAIDRIVFRRYAEPPAFIEDRIEALTRRQRDQIATQFASWRRLWQEGESAVALYREGKMREAIGEIDQVVRETKPDTPASQSLYDELIAKRQRWDTVLAAFETANTLDSGANIPERMVAWQGFANLLAQGEDDWQIRQAYDGAMRIRDELNQTLENLFEENAGDWDSYRDNAITSTMRQPNSPRDDFATPAAVLRKMAIAADEILRVNAMARSVELDSKAKSAVSMARQILAEQGGQAQSLWNLGRLYRDRGQISNFRECLERIIMLGDNASNPFYVEASKILAEETNEAASNNR